MPTAIPSPGGGSSSIAAADITDAGAKGIEILQSADSSTVHSALGLGDAAVRNTGIGSTQVVLGNDTRLTNTRTPSDASVTAAKIDSSDATAIRGAIGAGTSSFNGTADATGSALHRWRLNEGTGTSFADSGSANEAFTLTGSNAVVTVPGVQGYGIRFTGSGSTWLRTGNSPQTPTANSFSVDGWVKLFSAGGGNWCAIFCKPVNPSTWTGLTAGISFYVRNSGDGAWSCGINAGGSYSDTVVSNAVGGLGLNYWRHLAATYDGTTLRLYIDGVPIATRSVSGSVNWGTGPWQAGGNQNAGGDPLYGTLSDWRVQSGVLTASEVSMRYMLGLRQGP